MNAARLSIQLRTFIDKNLSCFEDLQVLLFLHAHPEKEWNAVDVAEQLRIEPLSAAAHLMNLYNKGLIGHQEHRGPFYKYRYSPHPETMESQICELEASFERARMEVVDYISNKNRTS